MSKSEDIIKDDRTRATFMDLKVLVVDSSQEMAETLRNFLLKMKVNSNNIHPTLSVDKGFDLFCKYKHSLVIIDWFKDNEKGPLFAKKVRTHLKSPNIEVPIIMAASYTDKKSVLGARDSGISEFLVKPFTIDVLEKKMIRALGHPREFIISKTYVGPERRVSIVEWMGDERRDTIILQ